ncbi:MAG: ADP-ribosylglycohydrolase family protein [Bacillota bacterium]|nr:ADP-ribosylglycohydrolase family protein [Bacillota bacterium]
MTENRKSQKNINQFLGSLIGGAIGDALGWPVEFLTLHEINRRFGPEGINDLPRYNGDKAQITDDTQMTMFTAEGLLRAESRRINKGICHMPTVIYFAYQRWLVTQGFTRKEEFGWIYDGWLIDVKALHVSRAPGNSCISALASERIGIPEKPINSSKGCGAVMRSAPFGLFLEKDEAYDMAVESAALTHGHPIGFIAAGAMAYLIAEIISGVTLEQAVRSTVKKIESVKDGAECAAKLKQAQRLAWDQVSDIHAIKAIGEGWIAEEALGIAVYCALRHQIDFKKALIAAVNHDGDSDSTGSITGNIIGSFIGIEHIPEEWIHAIELKDELEILAEDLLIGYDERDEWQHKYPGY